MEKLQKRYESWLADRHNGEILFFAGFIIYLGRNVWSTTTFPLPGPVSKLCLLMPLLFMGLKVLLFDRYRVVPVLLLGLSVAVAFLDYRYSTYLNVLFWTVMVVGSKDIPLEKILKVYLVITGSIVLLAFCSSLLGVIENFQYSSLRRGVRNSFGITYTTDFASHIFFLILVYFYLKGETLKFYHYAGTIAAAALIYQYCNARLDSGSIALIAVVFAVGNWIEHSGYRNCRDLWRKLWSFAGVFVMPLLAAVSFAATVLYQPGNRILSELNDLFSNRISLGKKGIDDYGYKLFGQPIDMVGNGGSSKLPDNYFFIDCSYLHVMLRYGVVFIAIVLLAYIAACYKNRHDLYFLYTIALVAVNCTIAHHLLEFEYNPFAVALLAVSVRSVQPPDRRSARTSLRL